MRLSVFVFFLLFLGRFIVIQWGDFLIDPREGEDLCRMAVLLAMTVDQKMERDLILQLQKRGSKALPPPWQGLVFLLKVISFVT